MHIFIDESGSFVPQLVPKSKVSAVGALIVPSAHVDDVRDEYRRLRRQFGVGESEIKGSKLTERQASRVISLLRSHDVIFDSCVIDIGRHTPAKIQSFRALQAQKISDQLRPEYHASVLDAVTRMRDLSLELSNQLFVQCILTIMLIERVLETATMYYAQRIPAELGDFHWRVDAKDDRLTPAEEFWTMFVLPALESVFRERPLGMLEGADYSHFERYDAKAVRRGAFDAGKILKEDLQFEDSSADLGLQLADNVLSILTRALNGTLKAEGWQNLGRLMIRRSVLSVDIIELSPAPVPLGTVVTRPSPHSAIVEALEKNMKPMLVR